MNKDLNDDTGKDELDKDEENGGECTTKKVLVVDKDVPGHGGIERGFAAAGGDVQVVSGQELIQFERHNVKIVVADIARKDVLKEASEHYPHTYAIAISKTDNAKTISFLKENENVRNIIAVEDTETRLCQTEAMVLGSCILNGSELDMQHWLPWGTHIYKSVIKSALGRFSEIERVEKFVNEMSGSERIGRGVADVIEELVANAIFHAPVDAEGNPKYEGRPRYMDFTLDSGEEALLEYASDGDFLVVSVTDNFGRLNKGKVLQYLDRCFARETDQVLLKGSGAGIGMFLTLHFATTLCFNVVPGIRTRVISVFNISQGYRGFRQKRSSIHFL